MLQTILSNISVIMATVGMAEKAKEFLKTGAEIYHGNISEGAKEHLC